MQPFFKDVVQTFLPLHWAEISQRPAGKALGFFSKVLACAFLLIIVLYVPKMIKLPNVMSEQLNKFEAVQLSGNITMSSPIKMPQSNPVAILDTSGAYTTLTNERLLITRDKIFLRPLFKTYAVDTAELKDLKRNREQVKTFLAIVAFFLLPSILVYGYVLVWLKYFLMIFTLSIIIFVLLDLTHWRRTWKELFVIGCYVSTLPVLAEVVLSAINARWLVPILNIAGVIQLYLIPVVILSVLAFGASLCVHYSNQKDKHHDV